MLVSILKLTITVLKKIKHAIGFRFCSTVGSGSDQKWTSSAHYAKSHLKRKFKGTSFSKTASKGTVPIRCLQQTKYQDDDQMKNVMTFADNWPVMHIFP